MTAMPLVSLLRRSVVRDTGLVLLLAALGLFLGVRTFALTLDAQKLIGFTGSPAAWHREVLRWWLIALPALAAVPLRRRWPVPAFVVAAAAAAAHLLDPARLPPLPTELAAGVTLFTLAAVTSSRRVGMAALLGGLAALYLTEVGVVLRFGVPGASPEELADPCLSPWRPEVLHAALRTAIGPALALGTAWAVGDGVRTRRLHLATLEQRAADLARERDQRAALAVAAERTRISRELHDVVAHGISVMVVQAQGAEAALRSHPDRTAAALGNVIDTGRASLAEMRRLLGLARAEPDGDPGLAPQPGVGALPALIDQVRGAGTSVELRVEGDPVPLPAALDLSVYRIVQEALTNTRRHAGDGAHAMVRLAFQPALVEVEVADDGPGRSTAAPPALLSAGTESGGVGNGLSGIAERVAALGGSVAAGPRDGGGFGVHAQLPLAAAP
jgi:signal transduction histidine kinase